jgi:hypothetical protein
MNVSTLIALLQDISDHDMEVYMEDGGVASIVEGVGDEYVLQDVYKWKVVDKNTVGASHVVVLNG